MTSGLDSITAKSVRALIRVVKKGRDHSRPFVRSRCPVVVQRLGVGGGSLSPSPNQPRQALPRKAESSQTEPRLASRRATPSSPFIRPVATRLLRGARVPRLASVTASKTGARTLWDFALVVNNSMRSIPPRTKGKIVGFADPPLSGYGLLPGKSAGSIAIIPFGTWVAPEHYSPKSTISCAKRRKSRNGLSSGQPDG
jgi:hypothetical protein